MEFLHDMYCCYTGPAQPASYREYRSCGCSGARNRSLLLFTVRARQT